MGFNRLEVASRRRLIEECCRNVGRWEREQTLGYIEGDVGGGAQLEDIEAAEPTSSRIQTHSWIILIPGTSGTTFTLLIVAPKSVRTSPGNRIFSPVFKAAC